jgi:hypothetical protein
MTPKRLLPLTGVLAVGFVLATHLVHGSVPAADASATDVVTFYRDHDSRQIVGAVLALYATFFYLAFAVVLRGVLRRGEGETASAFGFAGAIVFAVGVTIVAGMLFVLGDTADGLEPSALQALHALFFDLYAPIAVGAAIFLVGNGIAILQTRALPAWLGWLAMPIALANMTLPPVSDIGFLALGIWILLVSALLAIRGEAASAQLTA